MIMFLTCSVPQLIEVPAAVGKCLTERIATGTGAIGVIVTETAADTGVYEQYK